MTCLGHDGAAADVNTTATGKFKEAAEHALKCYEFYLDGEQGRVDTDAMTMYGESPSINQSEAGG